MADDVDRLGERASVEAWVLSTLPRAVAFAASLLRDRSVADDVVQDCYCRLLAKADVYDLLRDGTRILFKAVSNACVDRARARRESSLDAPPDNPDAPAVPEPVDRKMPEPSDAAARRELEAALTAALARLPVAQRAAVELKALGYSLTEIAEAVGVTPNHAGVLSPPRPAGAGRPPDLIPGYPAMTLPPDDQLDALLRDQLNRQAEQIDPRPLFHAIMARSTTGGGPGSAAASAPLAPAAPPRKIGVAHAARFLASAAALAACLLLGLYLAPAWQTHAATAEELVREARVAHRQPLDRCYLVELRAWSLLNERAPQREAFRTNRLWTRGDRFWMESANPAARWAWGRDDRGGIWIAAFEGRAGIRLDADEVPHSLDAACDVMSMRPDTLLDDVLRDFDLRREPPVGRRTRGAGDRRRPQAGPRAPDARGGADRAGRRDAGDPPAGATPHPWRPAGGNGDVHAGRDRPAGRPEVRAGQPPAAAGRGVHPGPEPGPSPRHPAALVGGAAEWSRRRSNPTRRTVGVKFR